MIVNVVDRKQLTSNPLFGEAPTVYQPKFSDEAIKNMVDWQDLMLKMHNKNLSNSIFSLMIYINNNHRQYLIATVEQYIYLLQTSLVAENIINLIKKDHENLIIIDVKYNLYNYFLLLRTTRISKTEYKFNAVSLRIKNLI